MNGQTQTETLAELATAPEITAVDPVTVSPVLETTITLDGSNFDVGTANTRVFLKNSTHDRAYECYPSSSTATEIQCTLLGARTNSYEIYAITSQGLSNAVSIDVRTTLASISPTSGSLAGGTVLTLTGIYFSSIAQETLVFIGSENILCDVISSSSTEIECITRAMH